MAKITRYSGNLQPFGVNAVGTERTVFGDVAQSDALADNINADYLRGWGIVGVNENPTKQDFNALGFTLGQVLSYLHQAGVPEYHATQEYFEGGLCQVGGQLYISQTDGNVGNNPIGDSGANWAAHGLTQVNDLATLGAMAGSAGRHIYTKHRATAGDGSGGLWRWDGSDLSTEVAADTQEGIYKAPDSDPTGASGAWVRIHGGQVRAEWFGAVGDYGTIQAAARAGSNFTIKGEVTSDIYIASTFKSGADTSIDLHVSEDGRSFTRAVQLPVDGRDPSITFFNGEFLIAVTGYSADVYDCIVHRSTDLVNWTTEQVILGPVPVVSATNPAPNGGSVPCTKLWAPEFFIDGETLYLLVSLQYEADQLDVDGATVPSFRPYYSQCTDPDTLTFALPVKLNLPDSNRIDAQIIKSGANYLLNVKDEYDKYIECYSGASLDGVFSYIADIPFQYVEGSCAVKNEDGTFNVYFDRWVDSSLYFVTTTDFSIFSDVKAMETTGAVRHGTIIRTDAYFNAERIKSVIGKNSAGTLYQSGIGTRFIKLADGANNVDPINGAIYYVIATDQAEVAITSDTADEFFICVRSDTTAAYIKMLEGAYYIASAGTYDLMGLRINNNQIIRVVKDVDGYYKCTNVKVPSASALGLRIEGGGAGINSGSITWIPAYGQVYTTSGSDTGTTTIHDMEPGLPIGFYFDLVVYSATSDGRIVLNASWLSNPSNITIDGSAGFDGKVVRVTKVSATKWSALNAG